MNSVNLIGRLTRDPELNYTMSGKAVCNFSIAVDRRTKEDSADFFDITCWNAQAESVASNMIKGLRVGVSGVLRQDQWEDKETGANRSKVGVTAFSVDFLEFPDRE